MENNKSVTAVELLEDELSDCCNRLSQGKWIVLEEDLVRIINKAKKMEKEQNIEFLRWFDMQSPIVKSKYTFSELYEKFYQETYKQD